ncbi:MAG: peptidase M61 [Pseudomonadota bacterium]|nr:peptidase M61 [Pseudomonadota bacterium]
MKLALLLAAALLAAAPSAAQDRAGKAAPAARAAYPGVIRLEVDATDTDRRIYRVRETVPVARAGRLTLLYPQWLPGNHAPTGQLEKLAGLVVRGGGRTLDWRRDPTNLYAFHVEVPRGVSALDLEFQFLTPIAADQGGRVVVSPDLLSLQWQAVVLYPAGYPASAITVQPSVRLPEGFTFATALERDGANFRPVSLETLVDSPLYAGRYARTIELDGGPNPVRLNIFADSPELLEAKPEHLEAHRRLVTQADAVFGRRRFDHYDFLVALTRRLSGIGLEHLRSSENNTAATYFTEWDRNASARTLLPHEYAHSWNGKAVRPAGIYRPDFNTPIDPRLLWLYEGQTDYWGVVLAARSGLITAEQARADLAGNAAQLSNRAGRGWRALEDTTFDPAIAYRRPKAWASWQRGADYYGEGSLVWLEADTLIRERSNGQRSLDDFARRFFSGPPVGADIATYTFEDIVRTLNAVEPYDWAGFLRARVEAADAPAPLGGFARGGYRLAYVETPSSFHTQAEASSGSTDLTYSLGLAVGREGVISSVLWEGPAYDAGLALGSTIVAVNGLAYDADRLRAAVRRKAPVELVVRTGDRFRTVTLAYSGGLRYPQLQRVENTPARLDDILRAR